MPVNGGHDLGGADGFGPVVREPDEPIWHAEWERAVFTMFPLGFAAGWFGLDMARGGIESMSAQDYLNSTYYEHWMHSFELWGARNGGLDLDELEKRTAHYLEHPDEPLPEDRNPDLVGFVEAVAANGATARREPPAPPRFAVGDRVRVKEGAAAGHTRRAGYIQGREGVVEIVHGAFVYADSAAAGLGEDPQHVYNVRFSATDLWGDGADPNLTVNFDVFEPYVEPAGGSR